MVLGLALGFAALVHANAQAEGLPVSASLTAPAGLNLVPSARMPEQGQIQAGASLAGPHAHAMLSAQIARPLSLTVRRTVELASGRADADPDDRDVFPALDVKLRLVQEKAYRPEVSVGIDSALGSRRTASEYIVASKRFGNWDATAGIGWGRMGEGADLASPFALATGRRTDSRSGGAAHDGALARPSDWFSGKRAAVFGGLEYFPDFAPAVSFKLDWNGSRWRSEKASPSFDAPAPWSAGLSWRPAPWLDLGSAVAGGKIFMGRLTLKMNAGKLNASTTKMRQSSSPALHGLSTQGHVLSGQVEILAHHSTPREMGKALREMDARAEESIDTLRVTPTLYGLRGPRLTFPRASLRRLAGPLGASSAEEIWRDASFSPNDGDSPSSQKRPPAIGWAKAAFIRLDLHASLSEPDTGFVHRTALVAGVRRPIPLPGLPSLIWGGALRLKLTDNASFIEEARGGPSSSSGRDLPGRAGSGAFAERMVGLPEFFAGWTGTVATDVHAQLLAGYLDEMYAGAGGEMLWRPFGKRLALGAEGWEVAARDLATPLASGLFPATGFTGFLKGWYEIPQTPLTLHVKAGRYLAGDAGATLSLAAAFDNGARLETHLTATNDRDRDQWGQALPVAAGVRLTIPIGGPQEPGLPDHRLIDMRLEPLGRRTGAMLENPLPLYEATEPFSLSRIDRQWRDIAP